MSHTVQGWTVLERLWMKYTRQRYLAAPQTTGVFLSTGMQPEYSNCKEHSLKCLTFAFRLCKNSASSCSSCDNHTTVIAERIHTLNEPHPAPAVTRAVCQLLSSVPGVESCGTNIRIVRPVLPACNGP